MAYAVEQMSGLRVESGLVESNQLRAARASLLAVEGIPTTVKAVADQDALAAQITAVLEQRQPLASRLVRLHQFYWLRLWLESGTRGDAGNLPRSREDMHIASSVLPGGHDFEGTPPLPGDKCFVFSDLQAGVPQNCPNKGLMAKLVQAKEL